MFSEEKETTVLRRQFETMMRLVTDYQTAFISYPSEITSNPDYKIIFNDNTLNLTETLNNLISIEKELIWYQRQKNTHHHDEVDDAGSAVVKSSFLSPTFFTSRRANEVIGGERGNHNPPPPSPSSHHHHLHSFSLDNSSIIMTPRGGAIRRLLL